MLFTGLPSTDVDALRSRLCGEVYGPDDEGWDGARRAWNLAVDQRPAAVALPITDADVIEVVTFAREQGLRVAPQATGHGASAITTLENTILLSTSAFAVNPGLYQTLPYDPFKDFTPVCELAISPHVFAVKPELGVGTIKDFVARAKADPDKFNVSTPPIGTTPQLQAEVLKLREGLQRMATVVLAGGGDALKALISGTVQLSSGVLAPAHPHIKAGAIKGLAVTGTTRWHDLPGTAEPGSRS